MLRVSQVTTALFDQGGLTGGAVFCLGRRLEEHSICGDDRAAERGSRDSRGLLDPEARNLRHTHVDCLDGQRTWRVQQVLVDPELQNDWMAAFDVNLAASREPNRPVLLEIGPSG